MQPLRWGPTFCSTIRCTFLLPSGQHQTLRVTGWESEVHPAPLTSPFLARSAGEEGGRGEGEGAALTPSPAPTLRERGDLVGGLGIIARHRRRIATAPLTSPFLARRLEGSDEAPK